MPKVARTKPSSWDLINNLTYVDFILFRIIYQVPKKPIYSKLCLSLKLLNDSLVHYNCVSVIYLLALGAMVIFCLWLKYMSYKFLEGNIVLTLQILYQGT